MPLPYFQLPVICDTEQYLAADWLVSSANSSFEGPLITLCTQPMLATTPAIAGRCTVTSLRKEPIVYSETTL